jgi:hypothetical protein
VNGVRNDVITVDVSYFILASTNGSLATRRKQVMRHTNKYVDWPMSHKRRLRDISNSVEGEGNCASHKQVLTFYFKFHV